MVYVEINMKFRLIKNARVAMRPGRRFNLRSILPTGVITTPQENRETIGSLMWTTIQRQSQVNFCWE